MSAFFSSAALIAVVMALGNLAREAFGFAAVFERAGAADGRAADDLRSACKGPTDP